MKKLALTFSIASLIFVGCDDKKPNADDVTIEMHSDDSTYNDMDSTNLGINDMHNSQNSLDWAGSYKGIIPCADCPGIELEVELKSNNTYEIEQEYLERNTKIEDKGNFTWTQDGSTIHINSTKTENYQFKVGENRLIMLDQEGNEITGNLKDKYILTKDLD